jgi:LacI family repressor for deo operon, udp, cdd, tsx, nupC, and nupG
MSSRIVAAALGGVPPEVTGSPTIQDVARLAKVSTATVSRALTRPERVAEPTRRAVLAAIERTGYRVNRTARNLRRRRAGAIVVLVPNLGNPFFSVVLAGIEATASRQGLNVLIADTRQPHARDGRLGGYLEESGADGIISLDGTLSDQFFAAAGQAHPPIVYACEWSEGTRLPSIRFDNEGGAALAVEHLFALGHRSIGHILGPQDNVLTHARRRGVERALRALALPLRPDWFFDGDFSLAAGAQAAHAWLALDQRPSAVTASSDMMACGFISELHRLGLDVPRDVSVVGFDDIELSERFIPSLTTIHQPRSRIGERAAQALIGLLAERRREAPVTALLEATLVVRASTGAPPPEGKRQAAAHGP